MYVCMYVCMYLCMYVCIFWGIKYEPLSDPPPVIKICEWGPWAFYINLKRFDIKPGSSYPVETKFQCKFFESSVEVDDNSKLVRAARILSV